MRLRRKTVDEAKGRWRDILLSLGVEARFLQKGHTSCPLCGGKDRYRFTDFRSKGDWICNQCGHGDGLQLLMQMFGWDWKTATAEVDKVIGTARLQPVRDERSEEEIRSAIRKTLSDSKTVVEGDPVWLYLNRRTGIVRIPKDIRYHPALWHAESEKRFPAMLAVMRYPDFTGASVHRTYLTAAGEKAPVDKVKKLMEGLPIATSCVRLSDVVPLIGIAEGIETAFAASIMFGFPVWASTSAFGMEKWEPPQGVEEVVICADNDMSFTGQAAAFQLAKRLNLKGVKARVEIPPMSGVDWCDLRSAEPVAISTPARQLTV